MRRKKNTFQEFQNKTYFYNMDKIKLQTDREELKRNREKFEKEKKEFKNIFKQKLEQEVRWIDEQKELLQIDRNNMSESKKKMKIELQKCMDKI